MKNRGQALTLEGSLAAMMIVLSLVFALQVSAVTPLTESTSSQHIENQQKEVGENVLGIAAEDGTLKSTVLYWNNETQRHSNTDTADGEYTHGIPTESDDEDVAALGELLDDSFTDRGIAYNIYLNHISPDHERETKQLVKQGQPSNHAVTVTRTVTLYEDDTIFTGEELSEPNTFFAENVNDESDVYNVVEVELVIWRM